MTTVNVSFADEAVESTQRSIFIEVAVPINTDKIQVDLAAGGVRLVAIAFGADWDDTGAAFSAINGRVPWAAGAAWQAIGNLTAFNIVDSQIMNIPYAETCAFDQLEFVLTTAQTTASKIGFFGWTG